MENKTYITCGSCRAQIELPAKFCGVCGARVNHTIKSTEEAKAPDQEIVYDWRILEVLKEWSPEVLTPRETTLREEHPSRPTATGVSALQDLARQIESGGSFTVKQTQEQRQEITESRGENSSIAFTAAAFTKTLQLEITRAGYPLACTVGGFKGEYAPPGEAVLIQPAGITPLAGDYIYALSLSPAGTDILLHPRLLRVNQLKNHVFVNILKRLYGPEASLKKESPLWGNRAKLVSYLEDLQDEFKKREAQEDVKQPPSYLPDLLKEEWSVTLAEETAKRATLEITMQSLEQEIETVNERKKLAEDEGSRLFKERKEGPVWRLGCLPSVVSFLVVLPLLVSAEKMGLAVVAFLAMCAWPFIYIELRWKGFESSIKSEAEKATFAQKDLSTLNPRKAKLEGEIAEYRSRRESIITRWLDTTWEGERSQALIREEQWFDRSFKDPNLSQVATLADKVVRSACERWFGKPPTLRLLDYES